MVEKRYRVHDLVKFDYSEICEYIGEGYTDKLLRNDEIVELLNENEKLKHEIMKLKGGKAVRDGVGCLSEETLEKFRKDLKDGKFIEFTAR